MTRIWATTVGGQTILRAIAVRQIVSAIRRGCARLEVAAIPNQFRVLVPESPGTKESCEIALEKLVNPEGLRKHYLNQEGIFACMEEGVVTALEIINSNDESNKPIVDLAKELLDSMRTTLVHLDQKLILRVVEPMSALAEAQGIVVHARNVLLQYCNDLDKTFPPATD